MGDVLTFDIYGIGDTGLKGVREYRPDPGVIVPQALVSVALNILRGDWAGWVAFANDMAEDETVIERVLENYRKGTR